MTVFIRALGLVTTRRSVISSARTSALEPPSQNSARARKKACWRRTASCVRASLPRWNASSHINGLFFDPRRYDLSHFGRYKMNKKLAIGRRIQGFVAARDIVAPLTGELLCAAGEKISAETAMAAEKSGVSLVYLALDDKEIKVISNGTVAANDFLSFDATECGINERVNFSELRAILDETSDVDEQRELLEKNRDRLISKTDAPWMIFSHPSTT